MSPLKVLDVEVVDVVLESELGPVAGLEAACQVSVLCLVVEEIYCCESLKSIWMQLSVAEDLSQLVLVESGIIKHEVQYVLFVSDVSFISDGREVGHQIVFWSSSNVGLNRV